MKMNTLYIIIAILLIVNLGQFIYFYSQVSDLKIMKVSTKSVNTDEGALN